jgi:hypothetical protein
VAPAPCFTLGSNYEPRELRVAQVARDDANRTGAIGHEASREGVGDVPEVFRRNQDPLPRPLGDGSLTVQYLARGLEAYTCLGGYVPQGYARQKDPPFFDPITAAAAYPFRPLLAMPWTIWRWKNRNTTSSGMPPSTAEAIMSA